MTASTAVKPTLTEVDMAPLSFCELELLVLLEVAPVPVADPVEPLELPDGVLELELELLSALAWKAAKVLLSFALTAKTIPFVQWPVCPQWNQRGLVSLTTNEKPTVVRLTLVGLLNPESRPTFPVDSSSFRHGALKLDCVTVWFLGLKKNATVSPTLALMLLGLYTS